MSLGTTHEVDKRDAEADYSALSLPTKFAWIFELKSAGVRFIDSPEFHDRDIAQHIDTGPEVFEDHGKRRDYSDPFLRDVSPYPLLTAAQEAALFRKYNYVKYLLSTELEKLPAAVVPADLDRLDRIEQLWASSQSVRDLLLLSNLRLVVSVAKKMPNITLAEQELWSLGASVVLTRVIEGFDYTRDYRFSTYAVIALQRAFVSAYRQEMKRHDRVVEDGDALLPARPESSTPREKMATQSASLVKELLPKLADEREEKILQLRFGLGADSEPHTLLEIAKLVGLSRQRVQQIEAEALERLQRMLVLDRGIGDLSDTDIPPDLLDRRLAAYHTQPRGLDTLKQYVSGALRSGAKTHDELMRLVKSSRRNAMRLAIADLVHQGEIEAIASGEDKRKTQAQTRYQLAKPLAQQ